MLFTDSWYVGVCKDAGVKEMYWWKFIEEGVEMGKKIKATQEQIKDHHYGSV